MDYKYYSDIFKVLSDSNRLKIIDILSCGEMCACNILKYFDITQPTFAHHMDILKQNDLVICRKEGTWRYYKLNLEKYKEIKEVINKLILEKDNCICKSLKKEGEFKC